MWEEIRKGGGGQKVQSLTIIYKLQNDNDCIFKSPNKSELPLSADYVVVFM